MLDQDDRTSQASIQIFRRDLLKAKLSGDGDGSKCTGILHFCRTSVHILSDAIGERMTISAFFARTPQLGNSWPTPTYPYLSFSSSPSKLTVPLCSPSPPTSVIEDELPVVDSSEFKSGCKACGKEEIEAGCNGEGRIQGGIATVPGFGWWPIKAYRPCPAFVASGGRYRRQGQSMDQVVSGSGKTPNTSNKKEVSNKSKR
ncbi:hypothetical protein VNO78_10269 [Psophocarpus tetragonolobus]|uniref:Uncharacterized protein n=1 Tax=Psophocarpus tetragonolobus TaxID=3891 RepID=A0AAN9SQS5_PSOTE